MTVTAASGKGKSDALTELRRADWSRSIVQPIDDARPRVNNGDSKSKPRRQGGGRQKGGDGKGGGWDGKGSGPEQWARGENWRSE